MNRRRTERLRRLEKLEIEDERRKIWSYKIGETGKKVVKISGNEQT